MQYEFEAAVSDGKFRIATAAYINVIDLENTQIRFQENLHEFRVKENSPAGTVVGTLPLPTLKWQEAKILFHIINKQMQHRFHISENGTIVTVEPLDREHMQKYAFTVLAEDQYSGRRESIHSVTITVDDVNDETPTFTQTSFEGHILENSPVGTTVTVVPKIKAIDKDLGVNGKFNFVLRKHDIIMNTQFIMNDRTGSVVFAGGDLDREKKSVYHFDIYAIDSGNLTSKALLTVNVIDENDNYPILNLVLFDKTEGLLDYSDLPSNADDSERAFSEFSPVYSSFNSSQYYIEIPETIEIGTKIAEVRAKDIDSEKFASISFNIYQEKVVSSQDGPSERIEFSRSLLRNNKNFDVNHKTGEVRVVNVLQPETRHVLNISAQDGGGLASHVLLDVKVMDVNDHAPKFPRNWYSFDVREGTYKTQLMGTLTAIDEDFNANSKIIYHLTDTQDVPVFINRFNGSLFLNGEIDREKLDLHRFYVIAEDQGDPPLSTKVPIEIKVSDVNDNIPSFIGYSSVLIADKLVKAGSIPHRDAIVDGQIPVPVYTVYLPENITKNTIILETVAKDADSIENGNGVVLYRFLESNPYFYIDIKNGSIWTQSKLDFEDTQFFNMTVLVSDLGENPLSAYAFVYVYIQDIDEGIEQRLFTQRIVNVSVLENGPIHEQIYDVDVHPLFTNQNVTFEFTDGGAHPDFAIDPRTGQLYVLDRLDREEYSLHYLKIRGTIFGAEFADDGTVEQIPIFGNHSIGISKYTFFLFFTRTESICVP